MRLSLMALPTVTACLPCTASCKRVGVGILISSHNDGVVEASREGVTFAAGVAWVIGVASDKLSAP